MTTASVTMVTALNTAMKAMHRIGALRRFATRNGITYIVQ